MKPGGVSRKPSQFGSKIDPQLCQTPVCAVISVRGPRLDALSLVPESYASSQPPFPTHRVAPPGHPQLVLAVAKACLAPEAPI